MRKFREQKHLLKLPLEVHPFRNLTENIVKLQAEDYTLVEQFEIINSTLKSLKGTALRELRTSLRKNADYHKLKKNNDRNFFYAPMNSSAVERSFSNYKNLLTDRRHSLLEENIEKHLIVQFNHFL